MLLQVLQHLSAANYPQNGHGNADAPSFKRHKLWENLFDETSE